MESITWASHDWHFDGIKKLQLANLPSVIGAEEKLSQGFVTCDYDIEDLQEMNEPYPHVLAIDNNKVVGYALVLLPRYKQIMPILLPMFVKIDEAMSTDHRVRGASYFVMGQICIDKHYRGQGLFYKLYDRMKAQMSVHYNLMFTEVSSLNKRSLRAHERQGFKRLYTYTALDGHEWVLIYWDWR